MNIPNRSENSLASVNDVFNHILTYDTDESIHVQIRHIQNFGMRSAIYDTH